MAESINPQRGKEDKYYQDLNSAFESGSDEASTSGRGKKREDYWLWERFHMSVAFLAAKRSHDPNTQVSLANCPVFFSITRYSII